MKFIRTKDGIYEMEKPHLVILPNAVSFKYKNKIVCDIAYAQADTIEELCDQFVYVTNNGNHYVKNNHEAIHYFIGEERPVSYYGAIWTDKGLIYVARLNDKGEIELL